MQGSKALERTLAMVFAASRCAAEVEQTGKEVFRVYRREYKKRVAWMRAGRITKDEFYSWSRKAREK